MSKNEGFENLMALIKRTDKENPKESDMSEMKAYLDNNSTLVKMNDCSELALKRMIEAFSTSELMRELIRRQVEEKRESFGYKTATIFERMLIDQVILSWIRLNHLETVHTARLEQSGSHSHASGLYWDKRLNSAQKRFMNACETLAKIRKHLAEAEYKEAQAKNLRSKSAKTANNLLQQLTKS